MSSWGTRRRNFIITIFLSGFFVVLATVSYTFLYKEPTCFDGKKNGNEMDVDCGGSCKLLCSNQALPLLVRWNRYFEVVPGLYNVVAYLENQNIDAGTNKVDYKFVLYDKDNVILSEKTGSVRVRPKEITPIVENGLNTGKLVPARISFEILNEPVWEREIPRELVISVKNKDILNMDGAPRVTAVLDNVGYSIIQNIKTIVILYDKMDNAIGVSSTLTPEILPNRTENILFTWPQNFKGEVARFELIPLYESN